MNRLSAVELLGLKCIAEDMVAIIFDETVLDRLEAQGLATCQTGTWQVTETGRRLLDADESARRAAARRPLFRRAEQSLGAAH